MPIDSNFKISCTCVGTFQGLQIWGHVQPPRKLGIYGTIVAIDLDLCFGCLKCMEVCTVNVFDKIPTPKHPVSELKVTPVRETDCFMCFLCEMICPVDAILVDRGSSQGDTLQALFDS